MEEEMLTLKKFEEAAEIVKKVTLETKLIFSDFLSEQTGNRVYLKPENMQFTGAYKLRGAYYKMSTLSEEDRAKGLITASAGNHAQGVAYAAKCYGTKATIVMPVSTPRIKVNRTLSYGAEVVLFGEVANLTGIILTKMDGTARGGIAVAIQSELKVPVKYIGVGETIEDLQKFDSDEFVNALFDIRAE